MDPKRIEALIKAANSSTEADTSVNQATRSFVDESDAAAFFSTVSKRLFSISEWGKNSSATSYALFDESGSPSASTQISRGTFIRIALYGSGKYDWVRVVDIWETPAELVLKVKPSYDPTSPDRTDSISHFFGPEAENNFCIQLDNKAVTFYVIGLNEVHNSAFANSLIESARNVAVANVGYYSGLQKAVWKEFATNFLKTDEEKAG